MQTPAEGMDYIGAFLNSIEVLEWDVYFGINASVGNCAC
jgi:hypothetical protein